VIVILDAGAMIAFLRNEFGAAIAVTNRVGGEFVTADHHEFDRIAASGICRIRFIR